MIQFQSRTFDVPLPCLPGNVLCPVNALSNYLQLTSGASPSGPAFVYPVNSQHKLMTSEIFIGHVRECLSSRPSINRTSPVIASEEGLRRFVIYLDFLRTRLN